MASRETLLKILDLARWAPSGDNTQPWRFEIVADDHIAIHGNDTREWCLYDFNGHASHMAHGALLETLRIAATGEGLAASWQLRPGSPDKSPVFDVRLTPAPGIAPDPLLPFIESRAATPLLVMTLLTMLIGIAIVMGPLAHYFRLQALPLAYFGWLMVILLGYMGLTQWMKGFYSRHFGWQ